MRRGGDHITVLEGVGKLASSHKTARVSDVGHEISTVLVCDLSESGIVPVSWIGRSTADNETGLEDPSLLRQSLVVNKLSCRIEGIWEGLEIN